MHVILSASACSTHAHPHAHPHARLALVLTSSSLSSQHHTRRHFSPTNNQAPCYSRYASCVGLGVGVGVGVVNVTAPGVGVGGIGDVGADVTYGGNKFNTKESVCGYDKVSNDSAVVQVKHKFQS